MIKITKVLAVGLLFAITAFSNARAQTNSYRTNVLLNLTFNLTAYEQAYLFLGTNGFNVPTARTVKVVTAGVISSIAHQAHVPGDLSNAKLYYRLSWTDPRFISQDIVLRTGNIETNVNNYVLVNFPDSVVTVRASLTGTTNSTEYANCNVSLGTSQGSFALHGIATVRNASLFYNKHLIDPTPTPLSFTATVGGSGSFGFHQAEWKGTVTGSGQKVEVEEVLP